MSDPALWSAGEQRQAIADRVVSARELLDAAAARYERHNGRLNAVVVTDFERAYAAADRADAATAAPNASDHPFSFGLLHGLPMTIKEVFDWVGTPSTWGIAELRDHSPTTNATTVDRLLDAGAIIYGKTNVPPMLGDWQTFNDIYGVTNNPWDLARTPGGSSGGSTAAVASGMSTLELGSDIGGSIRFPAHYTGIFGHKPTFGRVPTDGHTFPGHEGAVDVNVAGPFARTARDLSTAMRVLAGPPRDRRSTGWTAGVVLDSPIVEQDAAMTAVLQRAVDALADAGVAVADGAQPAIDHAEAFEVAATLVRSATSRHDAAPEVYADDLARYRAGERDYLACSAHGTTLTHREWIDVHNQRGRHQRCWAQFFAVHDVMLCPVAASPAPPHDLRPFVEAEIIVNGTPTSTIPQWFWAGWPGAAHLPSTVAPVGLTDDGLPVGIQIIAAHGDDETSLAFAGFVEQVIGPALMPPGY